MTAIGPGEFRIVLEPILMPSGTSSTTLVFVGLGALAGGYIASRVALRWLRDRQILDRPNQRSSHREPVPRGGGIGFVAVILLVFAATLGSSIAVPVLVLVGALLVATVSFADDVRPLPFPWRLAVQSFAIFLALAAIPGDATIIADGLPVWLDRLIAGFAWLWFINLFNFMDGTDGLAAVEAIVIAVGVFLLGLAIVAIDPLALPSVAIAAAAAGFLILNWHPARVFMGDVGSVTLGFVLGWLLIELAVAGQLAAALILPMFFLVDATSTLAVRIIRRQPLATAHRDHAYQAAVDRGLGHGLVALIAMGLGAVLIVLALIADDAPVLAALSALAITAAVILWMRFGGQRGISDR